MSKEVIAVDVSDSMLSEAKKQCSIKCINNVKFIKSDDDLSLLNGKFDFIHSFLVFQHIPVKRGEKLLISLLNHLKKGGIGAIHFTYHIKILPFKKIFSWIRYNIPFLNTIQHIIRKKNLSVTGQMQMNSYNINRLFKLLQEQGINKIHLNFKEDSSSYRVILFFKK